ncbi:uncharacterized protein LOC143923658 [Lithobates pipiens]
MVTLDDDVNKDGAIFLERQAGENFSPIRRIKMDRVVSFLLWPFMFLANSGKWLVRQVRPARDEERADGEEKEEDTNENCCIVLLSSFGAGAPVGSFSLGHFRDPAHNNMV